MSIIYQVAVTNLPVVRWWKHAESDQLTSQSGQDPVRSGENFHLGLCRCWNRDNVIRLNSVEQKIKQVPSQTRLQIVSFSLCRVPQMICGISRYIYLLQQPICCERVVIIAADVFVVLFPSKSSNRFHFHLCRLNPYLSCISPCQEAEF